MTISIVFETHSWSEDNERGIATGWNQGRLSASGRTLAAELGERRRSDDINTVFTSDLRRATETAEIAFAGSAMPILHDWRLRECNYGTGNGTSAADLHRHKTEYVAEPYPDGESWTEAIERVGWFLRDLAQSGDDRRVLVIGHVATRWGLEHHLEDRPISELVAEGFDWQLGWEFELTAWPPDRAGDGRSDRSG